MPCLDICQRNLACLAPSFPQLCPQATEDELQSDEGLNSLHTQLCGYFGRSFCQPPLLFGTDFEGSFQGCTNILCDSLAPLPLPYWPRGPSCSPNLLAASVSPSSLVPLNICFPVTFVIVFYCKLASALELYGALVARGEPPFIYFFLQNVSRSRPTCNNLVQGGLL